MIKNQIALKNFALMIGLLVAVCFVFSTVQANAQASPITSNYTEDVPATTFNPCVGGQITLSGQIHYVFHVTEAPSGQRVFRYHINYQGVNGVDSAGNQYRVASQSNDATILDSELRNFTVVQYFRLLGSGPAANERVRTVNHVTVNDIGEVTSIFSRVETDCRN